MTPGGGTKPDYDRRCQDVNAAKVDPAPGLTETRWYDPFESFAVTHAYQGIDTVFLRWGRTDFLPLARGGKGDWNGWGYRKIAAKHGWSPTIAARVQEALLTVPAYSIGTRWRYLNTYNFESNSCKILVLVQYAQQTFELVRGYPPVHIMTAYSWKV